MQPTTLSKLTLRVISNEGFEEDLRVAKASSKWPGDVRDALLGEAAEVAEYSAAIEEGECSESLLNIEKPSFLIDVMRLYLELVFYKALKHES